MRAPLLVPLAALLALLAMGPVVAHQPVDARAEAGGPVYVSAVVDLEILWSDGDVMLVRVEGLDELYNASRSGGEEFTVEEDVMWVRVSDFSNIVIMPGSGHDPRVVEAILAAVDRVEEVRGLLESIPPEPIGEDEVIPVDAGILEDALFIEVDSKLPPLPPSPDYIVTRSLLAQIIGPDQGVAVSVSAAFYACIDVSWYPTYSSIMIAFLDTDTGVMEGYVYSGGEASVCKNVEEFEFLLILNVDESPVALASQIYRYYW